MTFADQHVHSDNSPDGESSVIELCESAVAKGVSYIAVTDHCEANTFYKDSYDVGVRQSYFEVRKAVSVFKEQIHLLMGLELGQALEDPEVAESVIKSVPYDIVLGSIHSLPGKPDFAFLKYDEVDVNRLFADYLDELYKLVCRGGFDVLAHLTYPLRYINGEHGLKLNPHIFPRK